PVHPGGHAPPRRSLQLGPPRIQGRRSVGSVGYSAPLTTLASAIATVRPSQIARRNAIPAHLDEATQVRGEPASCPRAILRMPKMAIRSTGNATSIPPPPWCRGRKLTITVRVMDAPLPAESETL